MAIIHRLVGTIATGTTVGRWTVIAEAARRHGSLRYLHCRCLCGKEREVFIGSLRTGASSSCGCGNKKRTHGLSTSPEHHIWRHIKHRCHNANDASFHNYGGRGIRVCDTWRHSFEAFLADVGRRPSADLTLDRINNDGHYEPGNVRWATRTQQANNTRETRADRVRRGRLQALKRWHPEDR